MQEQQGWRSGECARLPPVWPGFDSGPVPYAGGLSLLLVSPCSEGFSPRSPVFLPPQKPISNTKQIQHNFQLERAV